MKLRFADVRVLRLAQACAAKKDVREYLKFVYIDLDRNVMVGSDGYRLAWGPAAESMSPDWVSKKLLVKIDLPKIPASWAFAELDLSTGVLRNVQGNMRGKFKQTLVQCVVVDAEDPNDPQYPGRYPDWERIRTARQQELYDPIPNISFNPALLADMSEALGVEAATLTFAGENKPILVSWPRVHGLEDVGAMLMPLLP